MYSVKSGGGFLGDFTGLEKSRVDGFLINNVEISWGGLLNN
jgi:hypothetical protein